LVEVSKAMFEAGYQYRKAEEGGKSWYTDEKVMVN
jgi:hypothetical protein